MGTAGVRALRGQRTVGEAQAEVDKSQDTGVRGVFKRLATKMELEAQEQAAATAALSASEKAAQAKTASLAASAGGGANINTNSQGSSSYTEGNPGQGDSQSHGDVELSTSDTTLRRRGGYRRDGGIRI